jgi:hypothetical protein
MSETRNFMDFNLMAWIHPSHPRGSGLRASPTFQAPGKIFLVTPRTA